MNQFFQENTHCRTAFLQNSSLCAPIEDDPSLLEWIRKKTDEFTSPEIQNEILKIMALKLLRTIAAGIHESPYSTVMIDETTDITKKEQCTVCIRWVNKNL